MSKIITAEYDAKHQALKLPEPLENVEDHQKVELKIEEPPREKRPWMRLRGILSPEAGEDLARAIEEAFGPIKK